MGRSKLKKSAPTHYRCRTSVSAMSVKEESSIRFGPGMLIRAEELEQLLAKGGSLEGRHDCFEPVEPIDVKREQDDGTASRS